VPDPTASAPRSGRDWLTTLGWAAYLACSWTWCIGMFLPVLLVRDFGIWGFVVFAVPNVLGAAAMGWVLGSEQSRSMVSRHARACHAFSIVTIAFQGFFLWSMLGSDVLSRSVGPAAAGAAQVLMMALLIWFVMPGARPHRFGGVRALAMGVWVVSAACLLLAWRHGALRFEAFPAGSMSRDLVWVSPVCLFGFGLCPYLDLTFHRTRQDLSAAGARRAFALGFGAFFVLMILGTLGYASLAAAVLEDPNYALPRLGVALIAIHMTVQLLFTIFVHVQQLSRFPARTIAYESLGAAVVLFTVLFFTSLSYNEMRHNAFSTWEVQYRIFMAFYGLVFPAYVWLCMIPTRDGHSGPSRGKVRVWLFAVGVAAPMFWMGFIERQTWWLAPGLFVVLAARLFLPRSGPLRVVA
jgi:hypothetical protein